MSVVISHNELREKVINAIKATSGNWHSWDYVDLIYEVINRIDNLEEADEELVWETCDSTIIYNEEMWTILKEWCTPTQPDWDYSWQAFCTDCEEVVEAIK